MKIEIETQKWNENCIGINQTTTERTMYINQMLKNGHGDTHSRQQKKKTVIKKKEGTDSKILLRKK